MRGKSLEIRIFLHFLHITTDRFLQKIGIDDKIALFPPFFFFFFFLGGGGENRNIPINPIAPYSIACGVLAWPDRFSYCAACLGWSNSSTEYTLKSRLKMQNLLYKICSIVSHLIFCMCTISDIKSIIIEKEPLRNHNATEIIRKLALAIDARSDTC